MPSLLLSLLLFWLQLVKPLVTQLQIRWAYWICEDYLFLFSCCWEGRHVTWTDSDPGAITRGQSQLLKMVSKKEEESGSLVAPQGKEWDGIDFFFIEVYRVSLLQLFSRTGINCYKFKQSNTNVLSYSSVGQKSDMSLTIERDSRNGSMASFSSCPHLSAQLNSQPLPSSSNQAVWVSLTSLP
jgi:hypothetical protein